MGFDDLANAEEDDEPRQDGGFDDLENAVGGDGDSRDDVDNLDESDDVQEETNGDPREDPAFPHDETKNAAQYVLPSTADALDDAWEFDVKAYLAREHGVRNVAKREWQNAVLRYAAENPEMVADLVVRAREEEHGPLGDE